MKTVRIIVAAAAIASSLLSGILDPGVARAGRGGVAPPPLRPERLVPVPDHRPAPPVRIDVRVVGGEGQVFYPGESVMVTFRTSRDAFVLIYDIDTEGRTHLLYPRNPWDSEFVRGGVTYTLPGARAGYRLMAAGPAGEEFIVGMAGDRPLRREWDSLWGGFGGRTEFEPAGGSQVRVGRVTGDRFEAIDRVTSRLIEVPVEGAECEVSRDHASFYIGDPACRPGRSSRHHWNDRDDRDGRDNPAHRGRGGSPRRR